MTFGDIPMTRRSALGLGGALLLLAAGCGGIELDVPPDLPATDDPDGPKMQTVAGDPSAAAYQAGVTGFAMAMLSAAIESTSGNAVVSPLSISQCVALVGQGANGATLDQIATMLGCTDAAELRSGANAEIAAIAALNEATFDMANTSFTDDSFAVKPDYAKTLTDWFGVAAHTVDFADPDTATYQINGWVAERTDDKIPELLEPGQVNTDTRVVLVNALYLNALWKMQFDPQDSSDAEFTLEDGASVKTKFMKDERDVPVAQVDGALLFELPYEDDDLAALFYLPPEGTKLQDAVADLTPEALQSLVDQVEDTESKLYIPVFEVRQRIELSDALTDAGMIDAFDAEAADFSALSDEPTYISFVQHEAWLKVAEKGTEGAAATAAGGEASAAPGDQPLEIRLDRPFLFAVRVRSTGSVAFIAAVQDPSS